jgi:hypothetical protein
MKLVSIISQAALAIVLVGCSHTDIKEIRYIPAGTVTAGSEVILEVPVEASKIPTYEWSSKDGGSFDDYQASSPKFKVPQKELVRISCVITVGGGQSFTRNAVLQVKMDQASSHDAVAPPAVAFQDDGNGPVDILAAGFAPTGWMGDGEAGRKYLSPVLNSPDDLNRHPNNQKWKYTLGPARWVAVAYQFPPNNWGARPGKNWAARHFREISFWARGVATDGVLPTVEFKAGNGTDPSKPYQDSFGAQNDPVRLTTDWRQYHIDLTKGTPPGPTSPTTLSNVVTGFIFALTADDNPKGATFYVAEITYR